MMLDGEELLFRRIAGDDVICLGLDANEQFNVERIVGIYDAWRAAPRISEYWGLVQFNFNSWESFTREQTFRWMRIRFMAGRLRWMLRSRVSQFKKQVAVERYSVLNTVKRLRRDDKFPSSWDVAGALLGDDWTDRKNAFERLDQIEAMLDALLDLGELDKHGIGFFVTGKGIAALSQYEEEERKHRESMSLQKGIRWLTVIMAIAALLQAKVVNIPALLDIQKWPWK